MLSHLMVPFASRNNPDAQPIRAVLLTRAKTSPIPSLTLLMSNASFHMSNTVLSRTSWLHPRIQFPQTELDCIPSRS